MNDMRLVRIYARILNIYHTAPWNLPDADRLDHLNVLFGGRKGITMYLSLAAISEDTKYAILKKAIASVHLSTILDPMLELLSAHYRLALLPSIVQLITQEVKKQLNIEDITIYSAHPLSPQDQAALEQWVAQKQHDAHIRSNMHINPSLIAGFRIEGSHFMGDYSVQWQLQHLKHICKKEDLTS
jgi:ATP synthase F1 delta subunit